MIILCFFMILLCYNYSFMLFSHAIYSRYRIQNLHLITCTYYPLVVLLFYLVGIIFHLVLQKRHLKVALHSTLLSFEGCSSLNSNTFHSYTFFISILFIRIILIHIIFSISIRFFIRALFIRKLFFIRVVFSICILFSFAYFLLVYFQFV